MAKSFDDLVRRTTTKTTRAKAELRARELLGEMLLREVRRMSGKSQRELADALNMKQPSISKLENQDDMQISTLRTLIEALGGEVQIVARFPRGLVRITQFDRSPTRRARSDSRELTIA